MHTPGPWHFSHRWCEGNMTIAEVYRKTGKRLCGVELTDTIVRFPYFRTKAEHDQALANARLISAAPELLAALERALEFLTANDDGEDDVGNRIASAKAAITKAKGETP